MSTDKPPELTAATNFGRRNSMFFIFEVPCVPRRGSRANRLRILIKMSYR